MGVGFGLVLLVIGILIVWASTTAPEGSTVSTPVNTAQRLARVLPQKAQTRIAFGIGASMAAFGIFSIGLGLWGSMKSFFRRDNTKTKR